MEMIFESIQNRFLYGQLIRAGRTLVCFCLFIGASFCPAQEMAVQEIQVREEAMELYVQKEYQESLHWANLALKLNPYDNEIIYLLGQLNSQLLDWEQAISFYERAMDQGFRIAESKYNTACAYSRWGKKAEAAAWLKEAINDRPAFYYQWMEDPDLEPLLNDPGYLNNLYEYDRTASGRIGKWRADIKFYDARMRQFHVDLFRCVQEPKWQQNIEALSEEVGNLTDGDIVLRLMQLTAMVGDGHTVLVPPISGNLQFELCPYLPYIFEDGIYVVQAHKTYESLLGGKILEIEDIPILEVLDKIKSVVPADNVMGNTWLSALALSIPDVLYGLGIIKQKDRFWLTYEKDGKRDRIEIVVTQKLTADFLESWVYGHDVLPDWPKLARPRIPTYQQRLAEPYWFEYLSDARIVVFHYNQVQTDPNEDEAEFMGRMEHFMDGNVVEALVVDLRTNEGGDNTIYRPILNGIIASTTRDRMPLFVLTGRRTFSAGMCFATELEKATNAIFIGEPTGSSPNFVGESGGVFQLPYSGIYINASNLVWQNSYAFDHRKFIVPDVYVPVRFKDYQSGFDGAMAAVKQLLNNPK